MQYTGIKIRSSSKTADLDAIFKYVVKISATNITYANRRGVSGKYDQIKERDHSFSTCCAYQRGKNVNFSENVAYVLNKWSQGGKPASDLRVYFVFCFFHQNIIFFLSGFFYKSQTSLFFKFLTGFHWLPVVISITLAIFRC